MQLGAVKAQLRWFRRQCAEQQQQRQNERLMGEGGQLVTRSRTLSDLTATFPVLCKTTYKRLREVRITKPAGFADPIATAMWFVKVLPSCAAAVCSTNVRTDARMLATRGPL